MLVRSIETIARAAGQVVLRYYKKPEEQAIKSKTDQSPVTAADLAADRYITTALAEVDSQIQVVSEETFHQQVFDSAITRFWLVDPLDGTRDFIKETDDFTINIALIESGRPTLGVIYAPVTDECYSADQNGLYRNGLRIERIRDGNQIVAGVSRSHRDDEVSKFLKRHRIQKKCEIGSSLKFIRMIDGTINIYPRFGPTSQWDIAAGEALLRAAGGGLLTFTGVRIEYGRLPIINPPFLAFFPETKLL